MRRSFPSNAPAALAGIVRHLRRRGGLAVRRLARAWYRRRRGLASSWWSAPVRRPLAWALLRAGVYDGYDDPEAADARTPLRAALRHLRLEAARQTGPPLDEAAYLAANPDLRLACVDPFHHHRVRGRHEGRSILVPAIPIIAGTPDFTGFAATRVVDPAVCVLVPVHGARAETLRCLHSLLAARSRIAHRILVLDDATPDPRLRGELAGLAAAGLIELAVNPVNRGFTGTVNRGLGMLRPGEDVVLLNSDTEVFGDWLDRLRRVARSGPRIGTATPLSNSATILSYPVRLRDNREPLELPWAAIDGIARDLGQAPVAIPTAVGFCMYVRADCLAETGPLDEAAFPRGYGEENEFCLRAAAKRWSHVAATDLFVAHAGGASFGAERERLIARGLATIARRHPGYHAGIDAFIARDPLAPVRQAIDCARVRRAIPDSTLWHWVARRPSEADAGALRLFLDPATQALRLRTARAPATPNITDMFLPYERHMTVRLRAELGLTRLRLDDPDWLGPARVRAILAWARAEGLSVE